MLRPWFSSLGLYGRNAHVCNALSWMSCIGSRGRASTIRAALNAARFQDECVRAAPCAAAARALLGRARPPTAAKPDAQPSSAQRVSAPAAAGSTRARIPAFPSMPLPGLRAAGLGLPLLPALPAALPAPPCVSVEFVTSEDMAPQACGCAVRVLALLALLSCSAPTSTAPARLPIPATSLPPAPHYSRRGAAQQERAPAMRLRGGTAGESGVDHGGSAEVLAPPALVMNGESMNDDEQPPRAEQQRGGIEVDMEGEMGPHGIRVRQAKLVNYMLTVMRGRGPGRDTFLVCRRAFFLR